MHIVDRGGAPQSAIRLGLPKPAGKAELEELEAQVKAFDDELAKVKKKEEEWKLELEHFQRQKGMVTNEREFTAVISEIDYATKALGEATARHRELDEAVTALNAEIEERRNARPEEEAAQKDVVDSWETRKSELMDTVNALVTETKAIEADVAPKNRARFMRLLESKKGTAVAAVVGTLLAGLVTATVRRETGRGVAAIVLSALLVGSGVLLSAVVSPPPVAGTAMAAIVQGNVPRAGLDFQGQREAVLSNHIDATRALADDVAAVFGDPGAQETVVLVEQRRRAVGVLVPEARAALDVGEEERDRSGGLCRHRAEAYRPPVATPWERPPGGSRIGRMPTSCDVAS